MSELRDRVLYEVSRVYNDRDAEDATTAIFALVELERAKLMVALDEARNALKIALPAVDEHGLNMDRHIVRKAIVGCDAAIATTKDGK